MKVHHYLFFVPIAFPSPASYIAPQHFEQNTPPLSSPEHIRVRISRVNQDANDLSLPQYATEGSAGMDVCAAVETDTVLEPGETTLVPTGFRVEVPLGFEAQIRPRSGLAIKHSVGIMNSPGTVDSDYRGEVKIILTNFGKKPLTIRRGDRIAQMIIARYARVDWEEVDQLEETKRGEGGFGHTGISTTKKTHA